MSHLSLRVAALLSLYRAKQLRPRTVIEAIYERIAAAGEDHVWICRTPLTEALRRAEELEAADPYLPLYAIPFAVKDNIDVEGFVTTAGCPAFAYTAMRSAKAIQTLLDAGAMFIGKTNLDQFATGLAGVRSPYGVPRNPFDSRYIPGGSSSGSAVAVASGLVSFALGTDTAGSGRVPAALNNIVGWKPTSGAVSTEGVVPACRSLDCVSVFALTCGDAALVARTLTQAALAVPARTFRFGVPAPDTLEFFGDPETPGLFQAAIENLAELGGTPVTVDIAPLREVGRLLYEGPWIAERTAALKDFLARHPGDMLPVTRSIIEGGAKYSAVQAFEGLYRLAELKQVITPMWEQIDTLLLPTVATTYTVAEVEADPIVKNSNLGYYTNFVNLLGYAGVSVPSEFTTQGLPFGVTLIGPGGSDDSLLRWGDRLHRLSGLRLGATQEVIPSRSILADGQTIVAVVGAHLRGLPLSQHNCSSTMPYLSALARPLRFTGYTSYPAPCRRSQGWSVWRKTACPSKSSYGKCHSNDLENSSISSRRRWALGH